MKLYHLDLKVTMYNKEYIKNWFHKLKNNGFSGVVVEIDNKLIFPSHPDFAAPDALPADEWNALVRFGKELGLTIYPLLQTLGHMEHILGSGTGYTHLAENPGNNYMLCPSKESTLAFIKDLIRDLYTVFDKPERMHLGGDEVYGHMPLKGLNKCPVCKSKDSGLILNSFLVRLAGYSAEMGMIPEFWADEVLASPENMKNFPEGTTFIDWNYQRASENEFKNTEYIKSSGYEVVIASGVRSWGDSYALPRIERIVKNTGISEAMSRKMDCKHLVTSWAVRLSHPETTWPGLIAARPEQADSPEEITVHLGGISREEFLLLDTAGKGLFNIDITVEDNMRFERPYYDNYFKKIYEMGHSEDKDSIRNLIESRIYACKKVLPKLQSKLTENKGDRDCLRHWISGIELALLRTEQAEAILNYYSDNTQVNRFSELLERNVELIKAFDKLWAESVTEYSLEQEKEIKFQRDIRILQNMLCK